MDVNLRIEDVIERIKDLDLEVQALRTQKQEARARLKEREERTEKLRAYIKELEARPTLTDIGGLQESINMLQARLNASEEALKGLRASHEAKVNTIEEQEQELFQARDERDVYMTRSSAEEILKEEAERKLRFWRGWGVVIGMMITNVIWWIALRLSR